jgi:hypothetical protein
MVLKIKVIIESSTSENVLWTCVTYEVVDPMVEGLKHQWFNRLTHLVTIPLKFMKVPTLTQISIVW